MLLLLACAAGQASSAASVSTPDAPSDQALSADRRAPWRVLILTGADPALPAMQRTDRALRATLQAAAPAGVNLFSDAVDAYRFNYRELAPELQALLRKKYQDQPIDLVIGLGDGAVELAREMRNMLWPSAPLLLSGLVFRPSLPSGREPEWQLRLALDVTGTLDLIASLQPQARRLVVMGGIGRVDLDATERVVSQARSRSSWQVESLNLADIGELQRRLAELKDDTAVFYTTLHRDATGRVSFPADALAQLSAASGAPIYGSYSTYVGRGVSAGIVVDLDETGRRTGELAIDLLQGAVGSAAKAVTIQSPRCMADHEQLQRYGLRLAALPNGCEVLNPPRTLWSEYKAFVLLAGGVMTLQALTIGALMLQRRRRISAEAELTQRGLQLARATRFAAMGELSASIAHEINQPLGAILSNAEAAELMLSSSNPNIPELREILADIRRDDLRANAVIRRMRALLEKRESEHIGLSLNRVVDDVMTLLAPEARRRGIVMEKAQQADQDTLSGDPVQLQQVLMNLVLNAMDAMDTMAPDERRLTLATEREGAQLVLTVSDRGVGIEPGRVQEVFAPFYTTKPGGMGMGLAISRAIMEAHRGSIELAPRAGGGATATLRMPAAN